MKTKIEQSGTKPEEYSAGDIIIDKNTHVFMVCGNIVASPKVQAIYLGKSNINKPNRISGRGERYNSKHPLILGTMATLNVSEGYKRFKGKITIES
jgi:hypothetical protein